MRRLSLFASPVVALLVAGCSRTTVVTASAPVQVMPAAQPAAPALPTRLSDNEFWTLETDISEPGGYFQIADNFTSNEMEVGQLFTMLRTSQVSGGVYMGVGPEQNFTYIAAIRPKMAFIVDIRRQAVMQHLMFKAMFELAPTAPTSSRFSLASRARRHRHRDLDPDRSGRRIADGANGLRARVRRTTRASSSD